MRGIDRTYTKTPVTTEANKVPNIANVTIAPKFEKNGFCKKPHYQSLISLKPFPKKTKFKSNKENTMK